MATTAEASDRASQVDAQQRMNKLWMTSKSSMNSSRWVSAPAVKVAINVTMRTVASDAAAGKAVVDTAATKSAGQ
eukprot:CAMPEP_0172484974 /NCGR_PEP_ID=MMETSP1066-20121228/12685_1 /TAXON_ID=671091 /ORGANISM="Coscinodiscus wailesii, Strain CCMP2513" /LENGTH=74 /DNA_ID=CAMNT_0013249843 /DNA_START=558 /DNA_END=782 /DNA_ORIENTATION=-